jgi:hypothetical protein
MGNPNSLSQLFTALAGMCINNCFLPSSRFGVRRCHCDEMIFFDMLLANKASAVPLSYHVHRYAAGIIELEGRTFWHRNPFAD